MCMKFLLQKHTFILSVTIIFCSISGCVYEKPDEDKISSLKRINAVKIDVPEPSDLAISLSKNYLWTVSDENNTVYRMDKSGNILQSFTIDGDDIEGITETASDRIVITLERTREVVMFDTSGNEIKREQIELLGDLNSGLEGITYNHEKKLFYVINEKDPGLLLILDENFKLLKKHFLKFALDYSAASYDPVEDKLWILSDESNLLAKTDLEGNFIEGFSFEIQQAEGVAFDPEEKLIYLISDRTGELFTYHFDEEKTK